MMQQPRRATGLVLATLMLAGLPVLGLAQAGVEQPEASTTRTELTSIELPDLSVLEDAVAGQVRSDHQALLELLSEGDVDDADLASGYGLLGQTLHAYELFDAAKECYRNAASLEPEKYDWVYLLGVVNVRQGELDEAIGHFQRAAELAPDDPVVRVRLGEACLEQGRLDDAEAWFRAALERDQTLPAADAGLGQLALARRDFATAVEYLERALAAVPAANQLQYRLAMAYRGLGEMERAREHLELSGSVALRVNDPLVDGLREQVRGEVAYLLRGRLAFAARRYAEASAAFAKAVAADPTSVRARVNYGTSLGMEGKAEQAMEQYRQVLVHDPESASAHFNLAQLLFAKGEYAEAADHMLEVLSKNPNDNEARLLLADSMQRLGRSRDALAHYANVLDHDPGSERALMGEAEVLVRLGRFKEALGILEDGHERLPAEGRPAHALARLLAACPDGSLRDGERALGLATAVVNAVPAPQHVETLAMALAELGRCDEAAALQAELVDHALAAGTSDQVKRLREALTWYEAGPPCRPPVETSD